MKIKIKKIIPYCLILITLVGLFSPMVGVENAQAQTPPVQRGTCVTTSYTSGEPTPTVLSWPGKTKAECDAMASGGPTNPNRVEVVWTADSSQPGSPTVGPPRTTSGQTDFAKLITDDFECGILEGTLWPGCFVQVVYGLFYVIPAFLLWLGAYFFNVLVSITLSGKLLGESVFVSAAWAVVRDLSNIFFILILLYIAIKTILGLGGSEVKKTIIMVVITALLINFSMFFTKVIVDTTNIIALVFYNKINVETRVDGRPRDYPSVTGEKDVAGGLVKAFDPTTVLTNNFFEKTKIIEIPGEPIKYADRVPPGILVGIIIIAGVLMAYAAYCFFQVGVFFLSRLIELWVLIIFSPYAFMSSSVQILRKSEGIGWDDWWHRLLQVSFLAPVFMFFLYIIFKLIKANPFTGILNSSDSALETILFIMIPALVILIILKKATEKAKKLSGELGGMMIKGAQIAGGLALGLAGGAAIGGAAIAGRTIVGSAGGALASKAATWAEGKGYGRIAGRLRDAGDFARKSSFDIRGVKIAGKDLASVTGVNLGEASKGGWSEMKKKQVEKRQKRAEELQKRGTSGQRKKVEEAEAQLNEATLPVKVELEHADQVIDKFRKDLSDAQRAGDTAGITAAKSGLDTAKRSKAAIRVGAGLNRLEENVRNAQNDLNTETGRIASVYAKTISGTGSKVWGSIRNLGGYSWAGADEAARRIRSGAKVVEEKH